MNKKQLLHSLLSSFSLDEIRNALSLVAILAKHKMLDPETVKGLSRLADELHLPTLTTNNNVTITTNGTLNQSVVDTLFDKNTTTVSMTPATDDTLFLSVSSPKASYKRSLDDDIEKLLS
jgi:hypothetical protein